jgi:hypothetical protein
MFQFEIGRRGRQRIERVLHRALPVWRWQPAQDLSGHSTPLGDFSSLLGIAQRRTQTLPQSHDYRTLSIYSVRAFACLESIGLTPPM